MANDKDTQLITSLESLNESALRALDSVLSNITQLSGNKVQETHSNTSPLIDEIAAKADALAASGEMAEMPPRTQGLSSTAASIDQVSRQLAVYDNPQSKLQVSLARTLASLLVNVDRFLIMVKPKAEPISPTASTPNNHRILDSLYQNVETMRNYQPATPITSDLSSIWSELQQLFDTVHQQYNLVSVISNPARLSVASTSSTLTRRASAPDLHNKPPRYSSESSRQYEAELPPHYIDHAQDRHLSIVSANSSKSATGRDLSDLVDAIERIHLVSPRLNNQRVELSSRQLENMTAARLQGQIERISRPNGKMESQRATLRTKATSSSADTSPVDESLISQIEAMSSRRLGNQRASMPINLSEMLQPKGVQRESSDSATRTELHTTIDKLLDLNGGRLEQQRATFKRNSTPR